MKSQKRLVNSRMGWIKVVVMETFGLVLGSVIIHLFVNCIWPWSISRAHWAFVNASVIPSHQKPPPDSRSCIWRYHSHNLVSCLANLIVLGRADPTSCPATNGSGYARGLYNPPVQSRNHHNGVSWAHNSDEDDRGSKSQDESTICGESAPKATLVKMYPIKLTRYPLLNSPNGRPLLLTSRMRMRCMTIEVKDPTMKVSCNLAANCRRWFA